MAGKASSPIKVTTAPIIPVAVENNVQVTNAATAIDAGRPLDAKRIELNNFATIQKTEALRPIMARHKFHLTCCKNSNLAGLGQ